MSIVHKQDQDNLLALAQGITNPVEGQIVRSEPIICKTCAYYVGYWCMEWMGSEWLPQPYSRESDYFETEKEAKQWLEGLLDDMAYEEELEEWDI